MPTPFASSSSVSGYADAARLLPNLPQGHHASQLHGHRFRFKAWQASNDKNLVKHSDWQRQLESWTSSLHMSSLNTHFGDAVRDHDLAIHLAKTCWHHNSPNQEQGLGVFISPNHGYILDANASRVWRRYHFHAAHYLPNVPAGHKCGRLHGHSFQVVLQIQLDAAETCSYQHGFDVLDKHWANLNLQLDGRCLNEIDGLDNPTSEICSQWIYQQLIPSLPTLLNVTVYETESCAARFDGTSFEIFKGFDLDSAIRWADDSNIFTRNRIEGHRIGLKLYLRAPLDPLYGWTADFAIVKDQFRPLFTQLDHHDLSRLPNGDPCPNLVSLNESIFERTSADVPYLIATELSLTDGRGSLTHAPSLEKNRLLLWD